MSHEREPIHEEKVGKLWIRIYTDEDAEDPRKWGSLFGTMSCFHSRYDLSTPEKEAERFFANTDAGIEEFKQFIADQGDNVLSLPIYMYDHSGQTIRTTPFSCPWDSGQLGRIWISRERAKKEVYDRNNKKPITRWSKRAEERVYEMMRSTISTMDQWMTGDVYGWTVETEDGEVLDSCWSYFGFDAKDGTKDYIIGEARASAQSEIEEAAKIAAMH